MRTAIVIPVRYGSTRFPGKPLIEIAGRSLVRRVWEIGTRVNGAAQVLIATDDERIASHAREFGAEVVMTDAACRNGSERAAEAVSRLNRAPDAVINLQGDTPLTPPWVLEALIGRLDASPDAAVVTPAVRVERATAGSGPDPKRGGTYVVFNRSGKALYFSRYPVPYVRDKQSAPDSFPLYRHIGVYGYRLDALRRYVGLPQSALEEAEQLEQLRALDAGMEIDVVEVDLRGRTLRSVDTPEDARAVEEILAREGEIVG